MGAIDLSGLKYVARVIVLMLFWFVAAIFVIVMSFTPWYSAWLLLAFPIMTIPYVIIRLKGGLS